MVLFPLMLLDNLVVLVVELDGVQQQHQQQVLLLVLLVEQIIALLLQRVGEILVELNVVILDKEVAAVLDPQVLMEHQQLVVLVEQDLYIQ